MPTETPLSKANYKVKLTREQPASRGRLPGGRYRNSFPQTAHPRAANLKLSLGPFAL